MSRPIDADVFRKRIDRYPPEIRDIVKKELRYTPTIERRKTGEWIRHPEQKNIYGGKCVECSECGEKYMVQYIEDEKFCRNCGSDMRGEQE